MSTSWQWFPDTKKAICNYCGFRTTYGDDFPGHLEHDCDPAKHPAIATPQGLSIGRSSRLEAISRVPKLLACIHRGNELRQEQCPTCSGSARVKIFACAIHGECQLAPAFAHLACCSNCEDFR